MKSVHSVSRLALVSAALMAVSAGPAAAQATVGVNAMIRNSVRMKTASDPALRPAVVREPVHIGDQVATGPQSALQVVLRDRSVFTVGSNARMTIDRFVYDPDRGSSDVAASVAKGAFRFMSGRSPSGAGRRAITTPVATIGVRGTIVEGAVGQDTLDVLAGEPGLPAGDMDPETASLVLLRGPGPNSQGLDKPGAIDVAANGSTVSADRPGQAVVVMGPGQAPFGPFDLSPAAFARLGDLLSGGTSAAAVAETASMPVPPSLAVDFAAGSVFDPAGGETPGTGPWNFGGPKSPSSPREPSTGEQGRPRYEPGGASGARGWYAGLEAGGHSDYSIQAESQFVKQNGATAKWRFRTKDDWIGFVRLGYRFRPNWRAELEGGFREGPISYIHGNRPVQQGDPDPDPIDYGQPTAVCAVTSPQDVCNRPAGHVKTYTVMFNVIYDFFPQGRLHPFVGIGLGVDKLDIAVSGKFNDVQDACNTAQCPPGANRTEPELFQADHGGWSFAYQGIGGVAWDVSDRLSVDLTYRFIHSSQTFESLTTRADNAPPGAVLQLGQFDRPFYDQSIAVGLRYRFGPP